MPRITPPDRLDRIHDAARAAFAQKGFAGTTMEDIARRVGIGRSALYSTYPNKEAVFRALVTRLVETVPLDAVAQDLGDTPAADLMRKLIVMLTQRLTKADVAFLPRLIVGEGAQFPDLVRFYHDNAIAKVLGAIRRVIEHGNARNEFAVPEPDLAARSVAGGIMLTLLWRIVFEPAGAPKVKVDVMAAHHAELVLRGLIVRERADG